MQQSEFDLNYADSELVLGLVAPVGTDLDQVSTWIAERLSQFSYASPRIRLSDFAAKLEGDLPEPKDEFARVGQLMTASNEMRRAADRSDVLALYAANAVHQARGDGAEKKPRPRTAHVLRSLKRPEEVATLRRIYGAGFFLVAVSSTRDERLAYLMNDKGMTREQASELLHRDEAEEDDDFGQRTRETFHLGDVFVSQKEDVWRFLDLVFGEPYITPTREEYAMFLAFAASVRSGDLSRQVGAVVVSESGEVIATGANDVPAPGGGTYWPDAHDQRDAKLGFDPNEARRDALVVDVTRRLIPGFEKKSNEDVLAEGKVRLRGSPLFDLTEFHRAVHAEMEALLACARSGISVRGATMFTTTYPCHNCAKHIVGAGIKRVIFVEPYAKSLAEALHGDAIRGTEAPERAESTTPFVSFDPFVGVGARRFIDLFSMMLGAGDKRVRKQSGRTKPFDRKLASLRVPMMPNSYIEREAIAAALLEKVTESEGADGQEETDSKSS